MLIGRCARQGDDIGALRLAGSRGGHFRADPGIMDLSRHTHDLPPESSLNLM
jgi:hypothetical protein